MDYLLNADEIQQMANWYVENNSTIRIVAKRFDISKSMAHIYLTKHLKKLNKPLYNKYRKVADQNIKTRHIRGGLATKQKFLELKANAVS